MEPVKPKFNIEQNNEELKVYMFTIQGGPVQIEFPEDFKAVLAYNDQGAFEQVRKDYPVTTVIHVKKRAQVEVNKILNAVNLPLSKPIEIISLPAPTKEKSIKDFIYGLMLISDKYVENKRDQVSLKRIINKIKINEAQTTSKS